ncbi:proton-conducting transporter membrane subunit [Sulfobacillus thermosulfidooxidans]|uniref:proton-conducting transporter transmembrane domain-containing protein n=1 Tax=Sulfobacillus thermosulfidooxidans TaxID=28034 RepID=UPI0006B440D7|nr:proton-conducting transporter membrane subunit [Sulfobacillus thermosulfidooxidans]
MEVLGLLALGPIGVIVGVMLERTLKRQQTTYVIAIWVTLVLLFTFYKEWSFLAKGHWHWTPILLVMTNLIAMTSAWDSIIWLHEHPEIPSQRYYLGWALFWASLILIAGSSNLAVSWVAIEFSTLASGALILLMGSHQALEAAWKYIVIASVGLALGLVGIIFLYAALQFQDMGWTTLNYMNLAHHYRAIPPIVRTVATILIVSGIGTKVGLVPFHTWLPDAHSEAPSPVSGLLSGVLLGLCLITIERFVTSIILPGGTVLSGYHLLTLFGALSMMVGSLALLVQRDVKRLLAYSSLEQMGIVAVALGIDTPLSRYAALLQLVFHAVVKSTVFYAGGHLSVIYHTKDLDKLVNIRHTHKALVILWALGILALAGIPPLGLAYSEWLILAALWDGHIVLLLIMALSLLLTFVALMYHLLRQLWGSRDLFFPKVSRNNPLVEVKDVKGDVIL